MMHRPERVWSRNPTYPLRHFHMVVVAQLAERWVVIPKVMGSIPIDHPTIGAIAQLEEQPPCKRQVVGSTPTGSTNATK